MIPMITLTGLLKVTWMRGDKKEGYKTHKWELKVTN